MNKLKIGIVGCGAIGCSLAKAIVKDFSEEAELAALYDIDLEKAKKLSLAFFKNRKIALDSLGQLIERAGLLIECSSSRSSWDIARAALAKGRDIMIMSVGGIVGHVREMSVLAKKHSARIYIPSGAIAGIDGLKAAKIGKIRKVAITTTKNPLSFKGVKFIEDKGVKLDKIKNDTVLFSGTASQAMKYFPQNINVAGVLSIAGIGQHKTYVKIIASPKIKENIHEIMIESDSGRIFSRTENIAHPDNPKTSYLAVLAAVATLKQILVPIKVGT